MKYGASIEYADQTDEIIREALRRAMSGTPGPFYIEYPSHVIQEELDVPAPLPPEPYRLVNQGAGAREVAEAAKLIREAKSRSCWSATAFIPRAPRSRSRSSPS